MIYLDNAATTFPKPQAVSAEISRCINKYCGTPGRSSHSLSQRAAEKIYEARCLLADLFSAAQENVVFTYNTTYALNIAIKAFAKEKSHILISDIEHNSVLRLLFYQLAFFGILHWIHEYKPRERYRALYYAQYC